MAVDDRVLQAVLLHGAGRLRLSSSLVALSTSTAPYCNSRIPQLGKLSCSGTRQRIPSQCTRAASPGARTRHADISNASQRSKGLPTQHAAARIRRYHENAHTVRSQKAGIVSSTNINHGFRIVLSSLFARRSRP